MASWRVPEYRPAAVRAEFESLLKDVVAVGCDLWKADFVGALQFGSTVAQIKPATDLDLILLRNSARGSRRERNRELEPLESALSGRLRVLDESGCHMDLSPLLRAPHELDRFMPIYLDFPDRSKTLYDPHGHFARLIDRIARYIADSGARRVQRGQLWYWDLAPDSKAGDVRKIGW